MKDSSGRLRVWVSATIAAVVSLPAVANDDRLPVPRAVIYPGELISAAMLELRRPAVPSDLRDTVHRSLETLVGKSTRRTLLPGHAIPVNAVREPDAVRSGKPVTMVFRSGGLVMTSSGTAMQAGAAGDVISAQSQDSGIVVRGTVQADGTLRLGD
jgi:flagellar basal body P-ring formation protein FlgA